MSVDYDPFAKSFSASRKNMNWPELEYFFTFLDAKESILDIGCGNGRLITQYQEYFGSTPGIYMGVDLSLQLIEEAKKNHPQHQFLNGNMLKISQICGKKAYNNIFFIASFHHLDSIEKRIKVLGQIYSILDRGGKVLMTNWALDSQYNNEKYSHSKIPASKNVFGSSDYCVKIGNNERYYHCFSLKELEFLAKKSSFKVLENRIFENGRNIITILQK